mmetsp:Transcript_39357/g.60169  ORF Transcript_39357/g.60169 Transcript_39357/m.60169 type:complete len:134 (-) Transcript_39357:31-432(-)
MLYYDIPKRTQKDILEEKEYKDFAENMTFQQRGLPNHLFLGHGKEINDFEKRDLATTHVLSYEKKMNASSITNSMAYRKENDTLLATKGKQDKPEKVIAQEAKAATEPALKPRAYNEFTKKIDLNYHKIGLRK